MANEGPMSQTIVVVGGGISGITAAVEAAEIGCDVVLVERGPAIGGRVAQLHRYFPKLCPPTCGLEINFQRVKKNPRIKLLTMATARWVSVIWAMIMVPEAAFLLARPRPIMWARQ